MRAYKVKARIFKDKWDWLFYIGLLIIPIMQVIIFYFAVNINSIALSFQKYDGASGTFVWSFETIKRMFESIGTDKAMITRLINSLIMYGISIIVILPLSLLFSFYYIQKTSGRVSFFV